MANYDFRSLSPHDFEVLCRDLLQSLLGIKLESFTAGPDSGIDFRRRTKEENLIVQCKHYADAGFDALRRVVAHKEVKKLKKLEPTRYFLTTSVGLTPHRKDELLKLTEPFGAVYESIMGRDDLNNLLSQHDEIERKHFKLWLTSEPVLQRVLHAGIFSDSEAFLDRVRLRLSRYVPNPSFERAQTLLQQSHFCIIAGIPGIGKTTLAQVLLADLVDRHEFKAFRIEHDLSELRPIKNPKSKQVFYFDDFLGKTTLDKLSKNEDQRLVELMEEVASNPNWRFILTTREYILNTAKQQYEAFANPSINFQLCIVNLSDYTRTIRAKILYNHIYFSDLPKDYKLALLDGRGYEGILIHDNYNPRVIEYMTRATHAKSIPSSVYLKEFVDSLDNPTRIWDHAFRHQISEAARSLLFVLATLNIETTLEHLEKAFWKFHDYRRKRFGYPAAPGDWTAALRELDGNFIKISKIGEELVVSFHSPSIKDFMEHFLQGSDSDTFDLMRTAVYYEQYMALWSGVRGRRYKAIDKAREEFLAAFSRNIWGPSARMIRAVDRQGKTIKLDPNPPSNENRAESILLVTEQLQPSAVPQIMTSITNALTDLWAAGSADKQDLVSLLEELIKRGLKTEVEPFVVARQCILSKPETDAEFRAAADYYEKYPETVSEEEIERLTSMFAEFVEDHPSYEYRDSEWIKDAMIDLEYIAKRLNVEVEHHIERLSERADEIDMERADAEGAPFYEDEWDSGSRSESAIDDIQAMFDGLKSDIKNN